MAIKLKEKEVNDYKKWLMEKQAYRCPICNGSLKAITPINRVLDHDHDTGFCRAVVCRGCNRAEGEIKAAIIGHAKAGNNKTMMINTLRNLLEFWELHKTPQTDKIYHKHKSPAELREAKNRKARLAYSRKKKEVKVG